MILLPVSVVSRIPASLRSAVSGTESRIMDFYHRPNRLFLETRGDLRPGNGSSRTPHRNGYSNEASFDTNMVIILAALLCALLCALGLNSIVRCALRFSSRFSSDSDGGGEAGAGLKKSTLKQIPVAVYGSGVNIPATDCPICLGEFMDGEKVRVLPKCHHGFHVRCIDVWLAAHPSCPTCRQSLIEQPPPSDAAADVEAGRRRPAAAVRVAG